MDDKPVKKRLDDHIFTAAHLWNKVPRGWIGAEVYVANETFDKFYPVNRIALHEDADGRKYVVVYIHAATVVRTL